MRIIHLLNHCQDVGNGIVNCAIDLACAQAESGNDVVVASGGGQFESLLADFGVRHDRIDQRSHPVAAARALPKLKKLLDEFKPDIVHCHMMTGILLAKLLRYGRAYQLVSHVHNIYQRSSILMGLADRVIVVNTASRQLLAERGVRRERIHVVLNGIIGGARRRQNANPVPKPLNHPAIVTVAGMSFRKGIVELISAFTSIAGDFPDAHLYLVGDGPDRVTLQRQATRSPAAARIHFTGFDPAPQSYMAAADLFVLASRRESFPLVLLEAREMGCPILSTDVDGCAEALDDGAAGKLVGVGDTAALATGIRQCLADSSLRDQLRAAARSRIDRITVRRMAGQVMDVYRGAIAMKTPDPAPESRTA